MEAQTCSERKIPVLIKWFTYYISAKDLYKDVFSEDGIVTIKASSHMAFNLQAKALRIKLKVMCVLLHIK